MSWVKSLRRGGTSRSWARGRAGEPVQVEVEQEDVDAGLAEEADRAALGVVVDQVEHPPGRHAADRRRRGSACSRALAAEMSGSMPDAEVVTMSTGRSFVRSPGV